MSMVDWLVQPAEGRISTILETVESVSITKQAPRNGDDRYSWRRASYHIRELQ
jgi:hypothetical protein